MNEMALAREEALTAIAILAGETADCRQFPPCALCQDLFARILDIGTEFQRERSAQGLSDALRRAEELAGKAQELAVRHARQAEREEIADFMDLALSTVAPYMTPGPSIFLDDLARIIRERRHEGT
jgi:hypothetical protein